MSRLALQRSLACGLGGLLIAASLLTLFSDLRHPSLPDQLWFQSRRVSMPAALGEATLGALLLAGLYPRACWWAALTVFGMFVIVTAVEVANGEDSCRCFGQARVQPIYTMALDLVAVAALLWTGRPSRPKAKQSIAGRWMIATAIALLWLSTITAFWLTRPVIAIALGQEIEKPGESVVLEPAKWAGHPFALTEHISPSSPLQTGGWIVLLVRHDCRHCAAAVQQDISLLSAADDQPRLAVIEMAPYSDADDPPYWELPKSVLSGRLDKTRDWVVTTPVALLLKDGIVTAVAEGDAAETPDPRWFKH